MDGHPRRGMKWFTRMFAVPSASAVVIGKHIRATAKAVREKEDVGISSSRYRQGQGDGEDGPANCLAGGLTRLMR